MDPDSRPSAAAAERLRRDLAEARVKRSSGEGGRRTRNTPIVVTVTDGRGRPAAAPGLARWLSNVAPAAARGEVAIALVSDARIRSMNKRFRRIDRATDVLSFPSDAPARASRLAPRFLGDIVIATGVARRQARESGHCYADELKVLALHGLLHLMGYDHHDLSDRDRMARVERRLRTEGGLYAGLIERVGRASARVGESEGRRPSGKK